MVLAFAHLPPVFWMARLRWPGRWFYAEMVCLYAENYLSV